MTRKEAAKRSPSKRWSRLRSAIQRSRAERALTKRFLIVCEDEKSSPNYFNALRTHFKLAAASVVVVGGGGNTQPSQIVTRAVELRNSAKNDASTPPYDEVWCVIDGDYGAKIANARKKARAKKIELAISTPCFEYWVLLHFEESAKPQPKCEGVVRQLKKHFRDYEKGKCDFSGIVKQVDVARERAERLRMPRSDELPEEHNPCSEVYKLVNAVLGARG